MGCTSAVGNHLLLSYIHGMHMCSRKALDAVIYS